MVALAAMLADEKFALSAPTAGLRELNPLASRDPHYRARAKRVIFIFLPGGPSHVDTFDPKPRLTRDHGKPLPFSAPTLRTKTKNLLGSPFEFYPYGDSGIEVSELFPHIGRTIDDICIIRSMVADNINHTAAALQMNTGEGRQRRPCMGSWLTYGLGTENEDLPGFIVLSRATPTGGTPNWSSSFLPAAHQGTVVADLSDPIRNLSNPDRPRHRQRAHLDVLQKINELHLAQRQEDSRLNARIASFELAFRMQTAAPEAFNLKEETAATERLYGIDQQPTEAFGKQCLMARRLVERGVRFVQIYHTDPSSQQPEQVWDQHTGLTTQLPDNALQTDLPIAGLLRDLKLRGLLEDTLVIWGGEFGRTPTAENNNGREHNPYGFTMWLAGGGVRGGMVYGATDEFGMYAMENKVHVHDLHATILHLLGLDHERLTYRHSGHDFRLTDVAGNVVHDILI
jgi:hypothetical protein